MLRLELEKKLFATLFKVSNSLQVYLDRQFQTGGLTAKQMFLMIVISTFGDSYPTLREAAEKSGSSYQNVKQLALKLQQQGFVEIIDNPSDKRKKNLKLTVKAQSYWQSRDHQDRQEMNHLFEGFSDRDIILFHDAILSLQKNIGLLQ